MHCHQSFLALIVLTSFSWTPNLLAVEYLNGIDWPEPPTVTPGEAGAPPSDAVVLLARDAANLDNWENGEKWTVENGIMTVGKGVLKSKDAFGDCQLHIEWSSPTPPAGSGQGRGNSGLFLMSTYEIQILDSYENTTYFDGQAAAIYKQTPPMVNAMRPPGEWNIYDIIWHRPHFDEQGELTKPATITALHNGILVLNNFELLGDTPYHRPPEYNKHADQLPIMLQDHGNPVRFRNIWVRPIKPMTGKQVREPYTR